MYFILKKIFFGEYLLVLPIAIILVAYFPYLFGDKYYIFTTDIAGDNYNQFWPFLLYLNEYVKNYGFPTWSFSEGIGGRVFPSWINDPFMFILILLPKSIMADGLLYAQIIKILLAYVLVIGYFKLIKIDRVSSIIGALGFSFCGHVIFRGAWHSYSTEMVVIAALLFSVEFFYQKEKLVYLTIGLISITFVSAYYFYIYSILIVIYLGFRWFFDGDNRPSLLSLTKNFIIAYLFSIGLSAWILFPSLSFLTGSTRFSGEDSAIRGLINSDVFKFNSLDILIAEYFRTFSTDMLGRGNVFNGYRNALEAPLYYAGILPLIFLFQSLFGGGGYKKPCQLFLFLFFLYFFFEYFRYFLNGFSVPHFKTSSAWISAFIAVNGAIGISKFFKSMPNSIRFIDYSFAIYVLPLLIWPFFLENIVFNKVLIIALFFIFIYLLILNWGLIRKPYKKVLLVGFFALELAIFSSLTLNPRYVVTKEMLGSKIDYNDYSVEAIEYIKSIDSSFYRVHKNYDSVFLVDAFPQSFNGTKTYNSMVTPSYLNFIRSVDETFWNLNGAGEYSYINGFRSKVLNTLLGVKYMLIKHNASPPEGYIFLRQFGDVKVFKNTYSLPLAFIYQNCLKNSIFMGLNKLQKERVLLSECVLPDESIHFKTGEISPSNLSILPAVNDNYWQYMKYRMAPNSEKAILSTLGGDLFDKSGVDFNLSSPIKGQLLSMEVELPNNSSKLINLSFSIKSKNHVLGMINYSYGDGKKAPNKLPEIYNPRR
jgi:hypothetical protein